MIKQGEKEGKLSFFKKVADYFKKNPIMLATAIATVIVVIVGVVLGIHLVSKGAENVENTGEVIEGVYVMNLSAEGGNSSKYAFSGNSVINTYSSNGETVTVEYTYVIAIEKGEKVIKLTKNDNQGKELTTTHSFEKGKLGDLPFISINDAFYYLVSDAE